MKRETITRIICTAMAALLIYSSVPKAYAEEEKTYAFDAVSVEKDLESIDGFDYMNYPYDPIGFHSPQIFNVAEWAYSFSADRRNDYALYVYFYNPQGLNIAAESNQNKIVLAVDYDKYPITKESLPTSYETFDLVFCSRSTGDYANLFYKFRVVDHESGDGKTVAERVNSNGRRYDISEILLKTEGDENATAYGVGGSYYFTGYAAGYGADENAESTLTCDVVDLETVELEVESTFFRTESSSLGAGHQNQLNTVYFGIPNEFLQKYGSLQKVKAEWYEYKTKPIYIVNRFDAYNKLIEKVGQQIDSGYDEELYYGLGFGRGESGGSSFVRVNYNQGFNIYEYNGVFSAVSVVNPFYKIEYLFKTDTDGQSLSDYVLKSETLTEYIKNYGMGNTQLPIKDGTISADLFEDHVDSERTMGKNVAEIDAGDEFNMLSYDETHNFWDKLFEYGLFAPDTDDTYKNIPPIYAVTSADLSKSDDEIAAGLFIDESAVSDFKKYAATATLRNETVHLFRFGQTDYYSEYGVVTRKDGDYSNSAMRAQETVFFDFTVISLTFNKEGVYRVIPAVSSPIDIIADITPPPEESFWLFDAMKDFFNSIWEWLERLFEKIGAWGMLILSIIIGLVILIIELKILEALGKINNTALRIILIIAFLAAFAYLDYLAVTFAIRTIGGLGGLA